MNNPEKSFDLLSLGEVLLRLSPPDNERLVKGDMLRKQVGGAELNVVSGVSLLGLRIGIISKLPANDIGVFAKNRIRFCGVSDDYLVYDESPDARLGIYYYENGAFRSNKPFSNAVADELEKLGAKYRNGAYYIDRAFLPLEVENALAIVAARETAKIAALKLSNTFSLSWKNFPFKVLF